jgi:hypothetical protein
MEAMQEVLEFLASVSWVRVIVTVVSVAIAVYFGIYWPARLFEEYTGQRGVRYIWYFAGIMMMAMVYISLYGYGDFWTSFIESGGTEELMDP